MSLHSKFLIHWTGKDFCDNEDKRLVQKQYLERLRDTCQHGFYMQKGREEISGVGGKYVKADIARVCFSEVRLSQVRHHADLYGGLGIGVHRDFIMEREGHPVFYVQNGSKGHVVENFDVIHGAATRFIDAFEMAGNNAAAARVRDGILGPVRHVMGYLKGMSERDQPELLFYDEMEWRVVHVDRLMGQYIFPDESHPEVHRLRLTPRDVRIIVVPDDATLTLARADQSFQEYFGSGWPIVTTLDESQDF
jgi:hypothetical protein